MGLYFDNKDNTPDETQSDIYARSVFPIKKCSVCGKKFVVAKQHMYKDKKTSISKAMLLQLLG